MRDRSFWNGVAAGAMGAVGVWLTLTKLGKSGQSRIVRLEKSIQIGSPVEVVFDAWSNLERLPQLSTVIQDVRVSGKRSHWRLDVNGSPLIWNAEITQLIPHQAIGWKSTSGIKHTGRITFSSIGGDTLVHVHVNYAPRAGSLLRPVAASFAGEMEGWIERVLREFKSSLESKKRGVRRAENPVSATGTHGAGPELVSGGENTRYGSPSTPVEYTRPTEAKS